MCLCADEVFSLSSCLASSQIYFAHIVRRLYVLYLKEMNGHNYEAFMDQDDPYR